MPAVVDDGAATVAFGAEPAAGIGRLPHARRIGADAADAARDQGTVDGRREPARMARLAHDGALERRGEQAEEGAHRPGLERERGRQLDEQHRQAVAEAGGFAEKA